MRLFAFLLALITAVAAHAPGALAQPDPEVVRPDPAVRRGTLPNGLRYAVMRNANPRDAVSMRLNIDVGSFEETDAEQGIAHFLEHMAFNGTRTIPEGELDRVFAAQGVAFGRDQNASTSAFDTTYFLDIAVAEPAKLDLGFRWLREVADGMLLTQEAVDRERGVVMSEHDTALGPARTFAEAQAKFLSPELRGPTRWPIGTRETLRKISAADLRAFYRRWYRPENASVVVVGDLPVDELERRVVATFGSWRGEVPTPARSAPSRPNVDRAMDVFVRAEPQLPTAIGACRVRPRDAIEPETVARLRRRAPRALWQAVLDDRLRRLAQSAEAPFASAGVSYGDAYREAAYVCLSATPLNDDWRRALTAALLEARRMELHGPTEQELRRAINAVRTNYRAAASQVETRRTAPLAASLVSTLTDEEPEVFSRPEEDLRVFEAAVAGLTARQVHDAFRRDWAGGGPLITLRAPTAPRPEELRAAWAASAAAPAPSAPTEDAAVTWGYTDFGPAGTIAKRETIADPGFTRVTFANGVVLNVKRVSFSKDRVDVSVRFGAGRSGLPSQPMLIPMLAAQMTTAGGLGKHDQDEMARLFEARRWSLGLGMGDNYYGLQGATAEGDLELQLQIMAAYLTDPGFRSNMDSKIPTAVESFYRVYRTVPGLLVGQALGEAIAPGGPSSLPPKEALLKIGSKDFARMMGPVLRDSPLEVTIVGDVAEEKAIEAASRTFGALSPRRGTPARHPNPPFLRYPAKLPPDIRVTHEGAPEKAVTAVVWPLYVAVPERRREEYALQLLGGVFRDAVRRQVREALGKSYSPAVSVSMPDYGDQGALTAIVETSPADAELVAAEIKKLASQLAAGGVTARALEEARKPMLDAAARERETNAWWLDTIDGSQRHPEWMRDALEWNGLMRAITVDEVNQVARTWLSKPSVSVFAMPDATRAAAAAQASGR